MMRLHRYEDYSIIPLRIVLAAIFIFAGINKALDINSTAKAFAGLFGRCTEAGCLNMKIFVALAILVMVLEIVGGIFLLFGIFTRYASMWLAVIMIAAIILVHAKQIADPNTRMLFFFSLIILGGLLTLILTGAKRPSIDEHFLLD